MDLEYANMKLEELIEYMFRFFCLGAKKCPPKNFQGFMNSYER